MPQDSSEQDLPLRAGPGPDDTQENASEYAVDELPARAVQEDGPARGGSGFDPTPYLRQLRGRGGGDYLDVKWRLLWLRKEHPDAELVTEMVEHDRQMAIFKATVTLPSGGKATGYGSETASDFPDFIEKAETKAIGRALNALGFGAQFGERGDDASPQPSRPGSERPAPRPTAAPPAPVPLNRAQPRNRPPARTEARPAPPREAPAAPMPPREHVPPPANETAPVATAPSTAPADADLAEYSWSAFWPWARERGLNGPREIEAVIGQPVPGLSPAELRSLIQSAEAERRG
ncbi:MAG: hypothetical protein KC442_18020 [Thermomicrobiales bacterium]|nr:hypothetical protein [Thermomicrobiales bacterium]